MGCRTEAGASPAALQGQQLVVAALYGALLAVAVAAVHAPIVELPLTRPCNPTPFFHPPFPPLLSPPAQVPDRAGHWRE
jgi:hypothetical protein